MDPKTLNAFKDILHSHMGIKLDDSKNALIQARIGKRMRSIGISSYEDYLSYVLNDDTGQELIQLLDAISTNVTSFFRGIDHFEFLELYLREHLSPKQRRIRIWSCACSSGEEPYSIAMVVLSVVSTQVDVKILATDISTRMLKIAQDGIYESGKVEQIPKGFRDIYFERIDDNLYKVKPALRNMITFKRLNLAKPPFPMHGPMDVVFCRNVMIYFGTDVRRRLVKEIYRLLKRGGVLFLGHSESLIGLIEGFECIRPSIYVKE